MSEHTHEGKVLVCQQGCLACENNQLQIKKEIETFEDLIKAAGVIYSQFAEAYEGNISPTLEAILRNAKDHHDKRLWEGFEEYDNPIDAMVNAFGNSIINAITLGMAMRESNIGFDDFFRHVYIDRSRADLN